MLRRENMNATVTPVFASVQVLKECQREVGNTCVMNAHVGDFSVYSRHRFILMQGTDIQSNTIGFG